MRYLIRSVDCDWTSVTSCLLFMPEAETTAHGSCRLYKQGNRRPFASGFLQQFVQTTRKTSLTTLLYTPRLLSEYSNMGSVELPWIKTNPSIVFFTDFDGTITLEDSKLPVCLRNAPWWTRS